MSFLSDLSSSVITIAAVLAALAALLKYAKSPMQRFLGIDKTPGDVYTLLDEVHTGVSFLVGLALADNGNEEASPEVIAALETLQDAGYDVHVEDHDE